MSFNLSEWALRNRTLVVYAMIVLAVLGFMSYRSLGQSEDPPFTFKAMVVRTVWPGATADEVSKQVTERIEKALMTTGKYEFIRSYSRPGESQVIMIARDSLSSKDVPDLAIEVVWTHGGLEKKDIYRALGVRELWTWEQGSGISVLRDGEYHETPRSELFPDLDLRIMSRFVDQSSHSQAVREFRSALRAG